MSSSVVILTTTRGTVCEGPRGLPRSGPGEGVPGGVSGELRWSARGAREGRRAGLQRERRTRQLGSMRRRAGAGSRWSQGKRRPVGSEQRKLQRAEGQRGWETGR